MATRIRGDQCRCTGGRYRRSFFHPFSFVVCATDNAMGFPFAVLAEDLPRQINLVASFPNCFPHSGEEVVQDQGAVVSYLVFVAAYRIKLGRWCQLLSHFGMFRVLVFSHTSCAVIQL